MFAAVLRYPLPFWFFPSVPIKLFLFFSFSFTSSSLGSCVRFWVSFFACLLPRRVQDTSSVPLLRSFLSDLSSTPCCSFSICNQHGHFLWTRCHGLLLLFIRTVDVPQVSRPSLSLVDAYQRLFHRLPKFLPRLGRVRSSILHPFPQDEKQPPEKTLRKERGARWWSSVMVCSNRG